MVKYNIEIKDTFNTDMKTLYKYAEDDARDHFTRLFCESEGRKDYEFVKVELEGTPVQKDEYTTVYKFVGYAYER